MNKHDARDLVYQLTIDSLRRIGKSRNEWTRFKNWPKDLTEVGKAKVAAEFEALAAKLEAKIRPTAPINVVDFTEEPDEHPDEKSGNTKGT